MATGIALVGKSGSGKSTSLFPNNQIGIKGLNPKETFLFNVMGKPLPSKEAVKGYKHFNKDPKTGNYYEGTDMLKTIKILDYINTKRPDIKNIIIDDWQYFMADYFMEEALKTGFDKFNKLGKYAYDIIKKGLSLRDDILFFITTHSEIEEGSYKIKTIGKMLDTKVTIDGLFYLVFYAVPSIEPGETKFRFATKYTEDENGITVPAKTPIGMFEETFIPNDAGLIEEKVREFYELKK